MRIFVLFMVAHAGVNAVLTARLKFRAGGDNIRINEELILFMPTNKTPNDENRCVFCEIAKGRIKTPGIFWEDRDFMAFLSIYPSVAGFTVVIPKKHYSSDVLALPDGILKRFIVASKKVSNILCRHFSDVGRIGLVMEGTGVNHAHIKLIPMHGTEHLKRGVWKQYASGKNEYFNKYEGYIVSADGPPADPKDIQRLARNLRHAL